MNLNLKDPKECTFDAVSLGEIMLRLDPGEGRIRTARQFRAWEGGGEYNVVRGLRRTADGHIRSCYILSCATDIARGGTGGGHRHLVLQPRLGWVVAIVHHRLRLHGHRENEKQKKTHPPAPPFEGGE